MLLRIGIPLALSVCGAWVAQASQNAPAAEKGVFLILSGERRVGTEKFSITPVPSGFEATGEIQLEMSGGPRVLESCSLQLDQKLQPALYEREQKSPKKGSLTAQFGPTETKLASKMDTGTQDRIFYLSNHVTVLDTNFFHHYALLLRQYDPAQPGPQLFNVFIPQEAMPGTIRLQLQGRENLTVGGIQRELDHFQAITDEIKMEIWATSKGEIYRISVPQANLEIVREEKGKGSD